jgi:DNA-binding beta-propeller fold protein YncE
MAGVVATFLGACVSSNNPAPANAENDGGGVGASEDAGATNDGSGGATPEASSAQDGAAPAVIATLAEGAISGPQHIAVSPTSGDLYVASFAGSYSVVAPTGAVTGTFGATGAVHLVHAVGIALDAQGDVYVGDYGANAVLKFDSTGNYAATFDGSGSSLTFGRITGVAVDANGSVYAADDDNGRIVVMNAQGSVTGQIATVPDGGGSVEGTTGIAVSGTDVWAAEYYDRDVEEIDTAGAVVASFGVGGTSATLGAFSQPYALALAGTTLYVADNGANTVQALSTSGVFAWIVSGTVLDGSVVNPAGVAVSGDGTKLYVSDGAGGRIVVYGL